MERYVLVVDDNPPMLTKTAKAWAECGYIQRCVKTGEEAVEEISAAQKTGNDIPLIALVADYLEARLIPMAKLVRRVTALPLLILTSEYNPRIKSEAFILGADRYLPIPETITEGIISGLELIRRHDVSGVMAQDSAAIMLPHDIYISTEQRRVFHLNYEIHLTNKEFDLLWYFAVNKNQTLRYERIYEEVWGDEYREDSNRAIWATAKRLRDKLKAAPGAPDYIHNERYVGYRFEI